MDQYTAMIRSTVTVLSVLTIFGLHSSGCGKNNYELDEEETRLVSRLGIEFDPALEGGRAKKLAAGDLVYLNRMEFDPARATIHPVSARARYYQKIFPHGPMSFVGERIGVFLSSKTNVYDLLVESSSGGARRMDEGEGDDTVYIKASNVGVPLWWSSELYRDQHGKYLSLKLGSRKVRISSSRAGVIQLGDVYSRQMTKVDRAATLVHEARHSDCVGGLSRHDLSRIAGGQLPSNLACGNLHAICPEGHAYAGIAACDEVAWGAYAVEAILLTRIAVACRNCSEEERQVALFMTSDRYGRLLKHDDLLQGKLGEPDLTSLGLVGP